MLYLRGRTNRGIQSSSCRRDTFVLIPDVANHSQPRMQFELIRMRTLLTKSCRRGHLRRHTKAHTGVKPYQCPIPGCTSKFSRQDNMVQHYRVHSRRLEGEHKSKEEPLNESLNTDDKGAVARKIAADKILSLSNVTTSPSAGTQNDTPQTIDSEEGSTPMVDGINSSEQASPYETGGPFESQGQVLFVSASSPLMKKLTSFLNLGLMITTIFRLRICNRLPIF